MKGKVQGLRFKVRGATLIESLTALAIVTTVMGAAFTLYEKTVSRQQQVMKTRAKLIQSGFESQFHQIETLPDLSNEFVNVNMDATPYRQQADVQQVSLTITNKQGKEILKKNYLRYLPTGK